MCPTEYRVLSNDELRDRVALLREANDSAAAYRANLEAIQELDVPSEDEIATVAGYRADLEAIQELDVPSENEIAVAARHRADLEVIKELS